MQYSELFDSFWTKYGLEEQISNVRKGPKRKAAEAWSKRLKEWVQENPGCDEQAFAQHVWRGLESQKANRRALRGAGKFVPELPMVTTWLNQWRFEIEQDTPTSELRRMAAISMSCHVDGCRDAVIGRSFHGKGICKKHDLEDWAEQNRDSFRRRLQSNPRLPGESWRDWSMRDLERTPLGRAVLKRFSQRHSAAQGEE